IVRRRGARYQVVLGRARLQAARTLGMEKVPVIIRNLSDNEVLLLIIEEAVNQKGFQNRRFSERVAMVSSYYELLKSQGIRTDLIRNVRRLTSDVSDGLPGERYDSSAYIKRVFGISGRTLNRYMRLNKVCQKVMCGLDNGIISLRSAVELSYLPIVQQDKIMQLVQGQGLSLKFEQSVLLRKMAVAEPFGEADILCLLKGTKAKSTVLKVDGLLKKYGLLDYNEEEVYVLMDRALNHYFEDNDENTNEIVEMGHI
ncbi:MAG: ParB/RepB/Spo0J family partition protein, partial [Odoribacter sp.]|nr:ParB/RepB/Spo0J family partition protein [Odoribacter sp.]